MGVLAQDAGSSEGLAVRSFQLASFLLDELDEVGDARFALDINEVAMEELVLACERLEME